ncbi:MAG TPA: hypothetical protein DCE42_21665 [Myxococcales bacterium]|nr:hypothetical protein [Deltaproteobacteria bacterium]HAA57388.1 hypothetical protein [Myxococcales bacterium]
MKRLFFLALVLFVFVIPQAHATAPSEEVAAKVVKLSQTAAVSYDKGEFSKALTLYQKAHSLWANPRLSFAVAKCQEALGNYRDALATVQRGLKENPNKMTQSRLMSKLAHLKKKMMQGRLVLFVTPSGASIHIDGKATGTAPIKPLALSTGTHKLKITHPNHATIEQEVTIIGGKSLNLRLKLQAQTGTLSITSQPEGAMVEIDGKNWGKTPLKDIKLPVGTHTVLVKTKGYKSNRKTVDISAEKKENLSFVLSTQQSRPTPPPAEDKTLWYTSWPGWIVLAAGLAAGGAGTYFLLQSNQAHQSVRAALQSPETQTASQLALSKQWQTANDNERLGLVLAGSAGGLVVLSAVLFATGAGASKAKTKTSTQPSITSQPLHILSTY